MHLRLSLALSLVAAALLAPALAAAGPGKASARPTVAILYFDYDGSSEEMGFLRKGLTQMLVSDLIDVSEVEIVERVRLEEALAELELNRSRKIDPRSASRVGKLLGARYLVMGGYFDIAGTLRMDARVVAVETGKVVASIGKHSKVEEFMALEQHLASELARVFRELPASARASKARGNGRGAGARPARKKPRRPRSLDARQAAAYGKALDALDQGDRGAAETILKDLVAAKPDFEVAAVDLASLRK